MRPTIFARTQLSEAAAAVSVLVDNVTRLVKLWSVATWSVSDASPPPAGTARVQRTIELVRGSPDATDCGKASAAPASGRGASGVGASGWTGASPGGPSGVGLLPLPPQAATTGTAPAVMTTVFKKSRRE